MLGGEPPPAQVTLVPDERLLSELDSDFERTLFSKEFTVQPRKALDFVRTYLLPAVEMADKEFLQERATRVFSFHQEGLTERLDKPVLILCGRQDSIVGYHNTFALLENFPRGTFAVLDRSVRVLPTDQEGLFRALVNEWLDRVEEASDSTATQSREVWRQLRPAKISLTPAYIWRSRRGPQS
jgi:pimeloyl-ACP methyl ester carboxylesterase